MVKVQITLPNRLAAEAQRAGLLSAERLKSWLRQELQATRTEKLFSAMDRMAAVSRPPVMSPEEVAREVSAMRAKRRSKQAQ